MSSAHLTPVFRGRAEIHSRIVYKMIAVKALQICTKLQQAWHNGILTYPVSKYIIKIERLRGKAMYKRLLILLSAASAIWLSACSSSGLKDSLKGKPDVEEIGIIRCSVDMNSYNKELTTAKLSDGGNAADFTSLIIDARSGDCIVFDNVEFTGAKCLVLEAATSENSTGKAIDLYYDEIIDGNKIGTIVTNGTQRSMPWTLMSSMRF